jgi:hypothetical protein
LSSVRIHMKVLVPLLIGWPLVLAWLGWYLERWRSWQWLVKTALAG